MAQFGDADIERLLANPGIIRNRKKIEASINNARRFLDVQAEFGTFATYVWRFVNGQPIRNAFTSLKDYPTTTPQSDALAKDLKKRGFSFLGSATCYAFMQSVGLVNDHSEDCFLSTRR